MNVKKLMDLSHLKAVLEDTIKDYGEEAVKIINDTMKETQQK